MAGEDIKRPVGCPKCGKRLSAPESYAGRKLKCPQCATTFPCAFAPGPLAPAAAAHVPSAFRTIEMAGEPKRSAGAEIGRLALGLGASVVGAALGGLIWGGISVGLGFVIGLLGVPIVGGLSGLGMRLGYGRSGDAAAGIMSAFPAAVAFVVTWMQVTSGHSMRGPMVSTVMAMAVSFTVASGISLGSDD